MQSVMRLVCEDLASNMPPPPVNTSLNRLGLYSDEYLDIDRLFERLNDWSNGQNKMLGDGVRKTNDARMFLERYTEVVAGRRARDHLRRCWQRGPYGAPFWQALGLADGCGSKTLDAFLSSKPRASRKTFEGISMSIGMTVLAADQFFRSYFFVWKKSEMPEFQNIEPLEAAFADLAQACVACQEQLQHVYLSPQLVLSMVQRKIRFSCDKLFKWRFKKEDGNVVGDYISSLDIKSFLQANEV